MKYRVIVTHDCTMSCIVEIEASSKDEANEKALEHARVSPDLDWEHDDGNEIRPYLGDPDATKPSD